MDISKYLTQSIKKMQDKYQRPLLQRIINNLHTIVYVFSRYFTLFSGFTQKRLSHMKFQ